MSVFLFFLYVVFMFNLVNSGAFLVMSFIAFNVYVSCLCIIITYLLTYLLATHYSDIYKCISGIHVCCVVQ